MGLIKCPECGKEVSDKSTTCVNCGYPILDYVCDLEREKAEQLKQEQKKEELKKKFLCPVCGIQNEVGVDYCVECGERLTKYENNSNKNPKKQNKPEEPKEPFYKKTWFVVLMCIFLPPVGLVLLWVSKKPRNMVGRIVLTVILALFTIMALTTSDEETETTGNTQNQEVVKEDNSEEEKGKKEEAKDIEEPKEKETEQSNVLTVGSSFEKSGLKITVNEASTDFQDYENEYGWNAPTDGMKYIMVSFTFENTGDSDEYVSIYDFDCYADNTTMEQVYSLDDSDFINTNLSPGRNISFKTYYEVPVSAQSIELEYETNAWTGKKVVIKLQ